MRSITRRRLVDGLLLLGVATAAGLAAGTAAYVRLAVPNPEPPPPAKTVKAATLNPVPHPRCFPEGTDGADTFRLCPDGLIDNQRSI